MRVGLLQRQPVLVFTIALQLVHLLYHQVTTLVDFFPFNGVRFASRGEKFGDAGSGLIFMGLPPLGFILRVPWLMEFGAVCYIILFAGECATWWLPYFFGPSPKWREVYAKIHARTITVIPRRGTNPTPNLEHLILMVLTLSTTVVTLIAYRAIPGAGFEHPWIATVIGVFVVSSVIYQCNLAGRGKPNTAPSDGTKN